MQHLKMIPPLLGICWMRFPVCYHLSTAGAILIVVVVLGSTLSNYQACVQIQDYLLARVAQKHHNIKFKALVIIKVSVDMTANKVRNITWCDCSMYVALAGLNLKGKYREKSIPLKNVCVSLFFIFLKKLLINPNYRVQRYTRSVTRRRTQSTRSRCCEGRIIVTQLIFL